MRLPKRLTLEMAERINGGFCHSVNGWLTNKRMGWCDSFIRFLFVDRLNVLSIFGTRPEASDALRPVFGSSLGTR
jgi:hypothetical protein